MKKVDWNENQTFEWRGKPINILYRTKSDILELEEKTYLVKDYESINSNDHESLHPIYRSIKPNIFIYIGISTHCGCSTQIYKDNNHGVSKHITDACHAIPVFDLAGRKIAHDFGTPLFGSEGDRLTHMKIPPHHFQNDNKLVIGEWSTNK